jgi:hypothetical protein
LHAVLLAVSSLADNFAIFDCQKFKRRPLGKLLLIIFFLVSCVAGFTQPVFTFTDSAHIQLNSYALLPDQGYSFEQVLTDTTLHFVPNDSIRPRQATGYWLKIMLANPSHYTQPYKLRVRPALHNTLYYFNADSQKWVSATAGIMVADDKSLKQGNLPLVLQGDGVINTLYVKLDVTVLQSGGHALRPEIIITSLAATESRERVIWTSWMVSITVLLLFFLHNLYIYYSFRDKAILFYLVAQVGAMVYITAYKHFFDLVFESRVFTFDLAADGWLYAYNYSSILMHGSVVVIMYGFVQLTRLYLNTRQLLPRLDAVLRYGLYAYIAASALLIVVNVSLFFIDNHSLLYENIFVLALVINMLCAGAVAFRRNLPAAGPFLVANMLPLGCILAVSVYHVFVKVYNVETSLLPDLAVISQSFVFSVALVARMRLIQMELKTREAEAQQLMFDIREIERERQLIGLENKQIIADMMHQQTRNGQLQQKLEANQRELAANALYMVQKNKLLAGLQNQITQMNKQYPGDTMGGGLLEMQSALKSNLALDEDWGKFKLHFEQVHPRFFDDLQSKHPSFTKNDIRLYAYFHMNLSTKEIATLMNIDPASVRQAKARLNKKMAVQ